MKILSINCYRVNVVSPDEQEMKAKQTLQLPINSAHSLITDAFASFIYKDIWRLSRKYLSEEDILNMYQSYVILNL